jgi:hypothetical protein
MVTPLERERIIKRYLSAFYAANDGRYPRLTYINGWYQINGQNHSRYRLSSLLTMAGVLEDRVANPPEEVEALPQPEDIIRDIEEWWGDGPADLEGTNIADKFETLLMLAKKLAAQVP